MGLKLASIAGTIHLSYFITLNLMDVNPLACKSNVDALNLLWWVHLLIALFEFFGFLSKK